MDTIEFGIDTFGDLPRDDHGNVVSYAQAIRAVVEEAVVADQAGLDVIAVGERLPVVAGQRVAVLVSTHAPTRGATYMH